MSFKATLAYPKIQTNQGCSTRACLRKDEGEGKGITVARSWGAEAGLFEPRSSGPSRAV